MGSDFTLTYYSTDIFPLLNRVMPLFLICGRESSYHFRRVSKDLLRLTLLWYKPLSFSYGNYVTWDQAQFSFRSVNNILLAKAKRKESLIQTFYETSAPTFLIDWHLLNQPTKITSVACFENCTVADKKNSFYPLKIKQSAQSYLTSCEIKGDVEGYLCWRRRQRVFEKTATRCSSFNILARRARI